MNVKCKNENKFTFDGQIEFLNVVTCVKWRFKG